MIASGEAVDGDELNEDEMADLEEKLELDYQVGEDLKEKVRVLVFVCFWLVWRLSLFSCCILIPFSILILVFLFLLEWVWVANMQRGNTFFQPRRTLSHACMHGIIRVGWSGCGG